MVIDEVLKQEIEHNHEILAVAEGLIFELLQQVSFFALTLAELGYSKFNSLPVNVQDLLL